MRFVVLLFGLVGVTLAASVGAMFLFAYESIGSQLKENNLDALQFVLVSPTHQHPGEIGLFLLIAAGYGFLGVLLAFCRCGWQGALMILVPLACASIMNPFLLALTGLLAFTGLLSFLVFPLPINAPAPAKDDADDDEETEDED